MALEARIVKAGNRLRKVTLAAAANPGDILRSAANLAGVVVGCEALDNGAIATLDTDCVAEVLSGSSTTFSAGAEVEWDDSAVEAVATGGAGDFCIGFADRAKTSGQLTVLVDFSKQSLD